MTREIKIRGHRCDRCGKTFTSLMRLQHHIAAEHAPKTSRDIRTTRDIRHQPKKVTPPTALGHSI